jgi:hypothetical protein
VLFIGASRWVYRRDSIAKQRTVGEWEGVISKINGWGCRWLSIEVKSKKSKSRRVVEMQMMKTNRDALVK